MKKIITHVTLVCVIIFFTGNAIAQQVIDSALTARVDALEQEANSNKPGEDFFMISGLATFGFVSNKTTNTYNGIKQITKTNSLADADHYEFSPMFLWRHGNKFLMEFEPSFSGGQLSVNWADISYFAAPGLILRGGYFIIPFGAYNKRYAAGWIDKLATDPLGVPDAPPVSDFGIEAEGGIQAGEMKFSYDVSLTNGLQLINDGTIQSAGVTDNNKNKTLAARIGWLPFSNSSLELGVSGLTGKVGDAGSPYQNIKANMYALDVNFIKDIKPFQLNIKGQYNVIDIGHADYINPADSSGGSYSFTNHTTTGFIQASLRPAYANNSILKNFEAAGRYGSFITPTNSIGGVNAYGWSVGLDYWLNWRTVIKYTYEAIKTTNTSSIILKGTPGAITQSNSMYLQFAIQL